MRFFVIPLLLAAAASAEVFQFVGQNSQSALYGVRGGVTVGVQKVSGEKAALEYNGTLALQKVREGEYLAKFTQFTLEKLEKIHGDINDETLANLHPEEQRFVKTIRDQGLYEHEMQKPVKFLMKDGKVVRLDAQKDHQQWSLNVFRGVITLLQNQVNKPTQVTVPTVQYAFEDGIVGDCKVQYQILSQPEDASVPEVYNITKTHDLKQCRSRPVYLHFKETQRGCAGVCDSHKPENFLGQYESEQTDFELKPTPGCPVNQQRKDSLTTVQSVAKYNVSNGLLDAARVESADVYRLFGGEIQVYTRIQLHLWNTQGPKVEEPTDVKTYETLQQRLPEIEEAELDIPIFALMKEHSKHQQYPQYFAKHFDAIIAELRQIQGGKGQQQKNGQEQQAYDTPAYTAELIQAVSGMTEQEIKQTMPQSVQQQQVNQLSAEEHLRRQVWLELIGKAGSKSSVKVILGLIKSKTLTPAETRRVVQDIAGFQSYPDNEMIEQILDLCINYQGLTGTTKATACVAAGKVISKGCDSKVAQWAHKEHQQWMERAQHGKHQSMQHGKQYETESEEYGMTMGKLAIKPELRCSPQKLQQYVQQLTQALQQTTEFKQVVAYINGLSQTGKPEALPELIKYVQGTASNIHQIRDQGEQQQEAIEFVRRVALLSLQDIAAKYPKEVNPVARNIFQNTTEQVQTRLVAFDLWMNTQPAQWEVEKIMQVANKDASIELTQYVYTALKSAMQAQEPCYQLLAQRIRAAWSQIRPLDFGMKFSQFRSQSYYNAVEDFGIRGIWKIIASNTTTLPSFSQFKFEQVTGPYMSQLFGAKLLVKGGEQVWEQLAGKHGLLERVALAFGNEKVSGEHSKLFHDIAEGMNLKQHQQSPKAVLIWKLFSGEAIIPIDAEFVKEIQQELVQTIQKYGKQGFSGHYVRVLVPTKSYQVEPSSLGFPIVHSTIHPVVISVRYENVKFNYGTVEGQTTPQLLEVSGTVQPTILSLRQSRVFVAEKEAQQTPTVKLSDVKEFNARVAFRVSYSQSERRFKLSFKPEFERLFHTGHCAQLSLAKNTILDEEPRTHVVDYSKCLKSLQQPIRKQHKIGGRQTGMTLNLVGETEQPWTGLPMFGSEEARRHGIFGAVLNRLANKDMKHHSLSLYLEADKQQPINEWAIVVDMDHNLEELAKIPVGQQAQKTHHIKAQYKQRTHEQLDSQLGEVLGKTEQLIKKFAGQIDETTVEKQLLAKIEGRYQGQAKHTIKIAMKNIYNLEKTEQQFALAAQTSEHQNVLEIFANASYPMPGSPFKYDPTFNGQDQRMNGTVVAKIGGEQMYHAKFQATKSEEQRKESELQWFEARCLAEQKAGQTSSDACKKAILKDNSLDRMEMTVKFPANVHPIMKNYAKMALTALKYNFYPQMQTEIAGRHYQGMNQANDEVRLSLNTTRQSAWSLLHNVRIEMPRENVTISNVRLPGFRPVHTQLTQKQQVQHMLANGEFTSQCVLGEKSVRTYDNVTFGLDVKSGCEYVLTRDQSGSQPDFTVTFQVVDAQTFAKKIRIQLQQSLIELFPFSSAEQYFKVQINGTQHGLTYGQPIVFQYSAAGEKVFINAIQTSNPHYPTVIQVFTQSQKFLALFDGQSAKTYVAGQYKGALSGICGNDDNQQAHEFIGPQGKEYQHSNEFIASYGIGQGCQVPVQKTEAKLMEQLERELKNIRQQEAIKGDRMRQNMREQSYFKEQPQHWQSEMEDNFFGNGQQQFLIQSRQTYNGEHHTGNQGEGYVLRTAVSAENEQLCFSAYPAPACKDGYHKEGVLRTERVESICLKSGDEYAIQAMKQIRQGKNVDTTVLGEKAVGRLFTIVNVPRCVRRG